MGKNGSIEHVDGPFASRKDRPRATTPGSNTEQEPKCDSNPSDGRTPGTGLPSGDEEGLGGEGKWVECERGG